jgi:zinc protease
VESRLANNVTKTKLKNGLTVLIKEVHHAPVATFWVWYRVGSRNEVPGTTGISHWVEHMQFKGTPTYPPSMLDKLISREGGAWNAFTFIDWTTYFEVMPAEKITLGIDLESDRMVNSVFDFEEVESERTVIISERSGSENSPMWLLLEEVQAAAFRVHPYHHEIIGDLVDLQTMTRDDLYNHYKRYYIPQNAVAVLVGDVDTKAMLALLEEKFGSIPAGETLPPEVKRVEPPQYGERRVTVNREGAVSHVLMAYQGCEIAHPDFFALAVMDSILAGASSFNFMSTAGTSNHTSRLYKALVETELASDMEAGLTATIDPFLYTVSATVRHGRTCQEVEDAITAELDRMARGEISEVEFEKARKQTKALFAYDSESVTSQGFWLGFAETLVGDHEWFDTFLDKLMAVSLDDVKRVAADTFQNNRRVVGWFVPSGVETPQMQEAE